MYVALLLTLLVGFFFLIGIFILNKSKNKERLAKYTIALAFVVMLGLVFDHLLPELIETKNIYLLIPFLTGFIALLILDQFIPNHIHKHDLDCTKVEHQLHLNHIGIITIVALAIHNFVEGIALYGVALNNIKNGLLMMLSISLHNIPLGFQIGNGIDNSKKSKILVLLLVISSFIGASTIMLLGSINPLIENILLSFTAGMLIYILFFELLKETWNYAYEKETLYGIITGIIVIFITNII